MKNYLREFLSKQSVQASTSEIRGEILSDTKGAALTKLTEPKATNSRFTDVEGSVSFVSAQTLDYKKSESGSTLTENSGDTYPKQLTKLTKPDFANIHQPEIKPEAEPAKPSGWTWKESSNNRP